MASDISFSPAAIEVYMTGKGSHSQKVAVTVPEWVEFDDGKFDVYFLADNTGSMSDVIAAVKDRAHDILKALRERAKQVGADVHYGVGNYMDFPDDGGFHYQCALTENGDSAVSGIKDWTDSGSSVGYAEGQFYALHELAEPAGGRVGWREDAKRIVIWIGDAPANDPVPTKFTTLPHDITESVVIERLKKQGIAVIAISVVGDGRPGLNADAYENADSTYPNPGGSADQANRIVKATDGAIADDLTAEEVVDKIIELGRAQITRMGGLRLGPEVWAARYRPSVSPAAAAPPADRGKPVVFTVTLPGASPTAEAPKTANWPYSVGGELVLTKDDEELGRLRVNFLQTDLTGTYEVQSANDGGLLQIDDEMIGLGEDKDGDSQRWQLIPVADGGYLLENTDRSAASRYLKHAGSQAVLAGHSDNEDHQWILIPEGVDGTGVVYSIQSLGALQALGIDPSKPSSLGMSTYKGSPGGKIDYKHAQLWRLNAV